MDLRFLQTGVSRVVLDLTSLKDGKGTVSTDSGSLKQAQYSFGTRFENGPGTNPEQLFAAGYSACFGGAIGAAAGLAKIPLSSKNIKVTATVNLNKGDSGFFIDVTLNAELAGVEQLQAEALVAKAHTICPYSKATRGNIEVKLQANGKSVPAG